MGMIALVTIVILDHRHKRNEQQYDKRLQVLFAFDDAFVLYRIIGGDDFIPVVGTGFTQMVVEFRQGYWGSEDVGQDALDGVHIMVVHVFICHDPLVMIFIHHNQIRQSQSVLTNVQMV
uniref:Uncharacterized protein n=1 Tax=Cacopsylla melanoneura TaxID=428564 RepID=A0A8D8U4P4_9HEMI